MTDPVRILVVDDDRDIRTLLAAQLEGYGFAVRTAEDGRALRRALDPGDVDLVVLDLNLPGEDGLSLCRELRARSPIPIVMLTARGETIDRILGLEMGADDYMAKPFEPRELVARIRNVLRRRQGLGGTEDPAPVRRLRFAGRLLDLERRQLEQAGRVLMLSGGEFRVLRALAERPHQVLTRAHLARAGGGRGMEDGDRSVDLQVSRLRAKLGEDGALLIRTVRSEGYVLATPVERER